MDDNRNNNNNDDNNEFHCIEEMLIVKQLRSKNIQDFMNNNFTFKTKSSEKSERFRRQGNEIFKSNNDVLPTKKIEDIYKFYTRCIAYAPLNSNDLALGYGNRSALLFKIMKYQECIADINRALEISALDDASKGKFLLRKVMCMSALGLPDKESVFKEAIRLLDSLANTDTKAKERIEDARIALKQPAVSNVKTDDESLEHAKIFLTNISKNPNDTIGIRVIDSTKTLVAKKYIPPGEIISVEKPFVNCLDANNYFYCNYCYTKSWNLIPCEFCQWCMFCSDQCKENAWKNYHEIECAIISYILDNPQSFGQDSMDRHDNHLSLKCLLRGVKDSEKFRHQDPYNTEFNSGFKSIYSIHYDLPFNILENYSIDITKILIILSKITPFFGRKNAYKDAEHMLTDEFALFIGTVLLKLRAKITENFHKIYFPPSQSKSIYDDSYGKNNKCKGACLSLLSCLIQHSCNPNVQKVITNKYYVTFVALQPIEQGSPLTLEYVQAFFDLEQSTRRNLLKEYCNILCDCPACRNNWPTLAALYKMPKENPYLYIMKYYNQRESMLFDQNSTLVKSILSNRIKIDIKILRYLSNAMEIARGCLSQPSVVICELIICLSKVIDALYSEIEEKL